MQSHLSKSYIALNQRIRPPSLTRMRPVRGFSRRNLLIKLGIQQLECIFGYLTLVQLTRLHASIRCSSRALHLAKAIILYIIRANRTFTPIDHRLFILDSLRNKVFRRNHNFNLLYTDAIAMDIDRSYSHRGHYQERKGENEERRSYGEDYEGETGVKVYLKRVLSSLANEFWKVGYVTGFHCFVNAMYRSQLEEDEAYMFASFLLRDMRCEQLYLNGLQRVKRLCYVLDVYLYNNLPRLHEHLKRLDIGSEVYAASWFITLFAEQLSLSILSKLWVLFILKGWKMLIKFSIAVLCAFETQIIAHCTDQIHLYLRNLLRIVASKDGLIWLIMPSVKVTNRMLEYLTTSIDYTRRDTELKLWQLKELRAKTTRTNIDKSTFSTLFVSTCCQRYPSDERTRFPYCI